MLSIDKQIQEHMKPSLIVCGMVLYLLLIRLVWNTSFLLPPTFQSTVPKTAGINQTLIPNPSSTTYINLLNLFPWYLNIIQTFIYFLLRIAQIFPDLGIFSFTKRLDKPLFVWYIAQTMAIKVWQIRFDMVICGDIEVWKVWDRRFGHCGITTAPLKAFYSPLSSTSLHFNPIYLYNQ